MRKNLIINWLKHRNNDIDILCFQEIKVIEKEFPYQDFKKLGFKYEVWGQKGFNGVAICSKYPIENMHKGFRKEYWDEQKRIIIGQLNGVNIINVYTPHGDVKGTDKFYYKLDWYTEFLTYLSENYSPGKSIIIVGDFNVARHDMDIYDPQLLKDTIGTMPEERQAFEDLLEWGLVDTFRYIYPDKQQFTWWDYIGGAIWKDQGMRIDYILCARPLIHELKNVEVNLWPRRRRTPTPSDHAPVIVTFKI